MEEGDELTVVIEKPAKGAADSNELRLERVYTEAEWKRLEVTNLKAALILSDGKVLGAHGAARLLGVPGTTLFARMKKAGINKREL